ncbi:MAG: sensor domain-containing diguanylate cyclase [Cyanobacteria bacterium P01_A01_bin.37]
MTFETMPWQTVLLGLRDAILQAETVDVLLRKTLSVVNVAYHVDSILWVNLDESNGESCRAYSTLRNWKTLEDSEETSRADDNTSALHNPATDSSESAEVIRRFRPTSIPSWLVQQQRHPQPIQLDTGDLIIPVVDNPPTSSNPSNEGTRMAAPGGMVGNAYPTVSSDSSDQGLRFVFQLRRTMASPPASTSSDLLGQKGEGAFTSDSSADDSNPFGDDPNSSGWTHEDMLRLQAIGDQLILACDALSFKRRLEQSQRHVSLLSRTSHILNTSIHPDLAIQQILSEMGQRMRSDRIILFDLRNQTVAAIATWERPRQQLASLNLEALHPSLWQNTIDLFLQGGASYLELQLNNEDEDEEPLSDWLRTVGVGSALVLPMFIREEFFGAIALLSHRSDRNYSLDELQMARQSSEQLSIAFSIIQYTRAPTLPQAVSPIHQSVANPLPFTDDITHLLNREALEKELDVLSKASVWAFRAPFSLITCDIDYFKLVNDNHGYDVGDRVLNRVAQRLQHQLRRATPIYRYGGEEFAIILEETDLKTAKDVAERLRQSIRSMPLRTETEVLTITASFGVAQLMPDQDHHALDVFKRSEEALFEAKRQGRDRVAVNGQRVITS